MEKPGVPDREERERLAEEDYQVQLRVYQAGVNEAAIFQIGFAVITAFLCSLIYYGDKAPADPKRHELFFEWGINIAVLMAAMGVVTFVGFRPFLFIIAIVLGVFTFVTGVFLLIVSRNLPDAICVFGFFGAIPLGLGTCCSRLLKAAQHYPR